MSRCLSTVPRECSYFLRKGDAGKAHPQDPGSLTARQYDRQRRASLGCDRESITKYHDKLPPTTITRHYLAREHT